MKVKITKCEFTHLWYFTKIGHTFEVERIHLSNSTIPPIYRVVDVFKKYNGPRYIDPHDCIVVPRPSKEYISHLEEDLFVVR